MLFQVHIWALSSSPRCELVLPGNTEHVSSVAVNGDFVGASGEQHIIRIWDWRQLDLRKGAGGGAAPGTRSCEGTDSDMGADGSTANQHTADCGMGPGPAGSTGAHTEKEAGGSTLTGCSSTAAGFGSAMGTGSGTGTDQDASMTADAGAGAGTAASTVLVRATSPPTAATAATAKAVTTMTATANVEEVVWHTTSAEAGSPGPKRPKLK